MKEFTPTFHKALDEIERYEDELTRWHRANPLREGQHVAVYEDASHGSFIAYGKIVGKKWASFSSAWYYTIQVCQSEVVVCSWSFHCREVDASEIRQLFTAVRQ